MKFHCIVKCLSLRVIVDPARQLLCMKDERDWRVKTIWQAKGNEEIRWALGEGKLDASDDGQSLSSQSATRLTFAMIFIKREGLLFSSSQHIAIHGWYSRIVPPLLLLSRRFAAASRFGTEDVLHQLLSHEFRRHIPHLSMGAKFTPKGERRHGAFRWKLIRFGQLGSGNLKGKCLTWDSHGD